MLLVVLVASLCFHGLAFEVIKGEALRGSYDFPAFYGAGKIVRGGPGKSPYDVELEKQVQKKFQPTPRITMLFIHPAFEALIFAPLAGLSYKAAYWAWCAISFLILSVLPFLLLPYLNGLRTALGPRLVVLAPLAFFPAVMTIMVGQDSILLLLIYTLVFIALKRGRDLTAGALLALGLFRFELILPFLPLLLARRKWLTLAGFTAAGASLCAVSILMTGWQGARDYVAMLMMLAHSLAGGMGKAVYVANPTRMVSLRGFIQTQFQGWLSVVPMDACIVVLSLLLLAGALSKAWKAGRPESRNLDLLFALFLAVALLTSFHTHVYDLTLLLLPILLVSNYLMEMWNSGKRPSLALPAIVLLLFLDLPYLFGLLSNQLTLLALPTAAFAVLILREVPGWRAEQS